MPDPAAWQAFGGVAAVVILLGGLALALQRLGLLRSSAPPPKTGPSCEDLIAALDNRVAVLEVEIGTLGALRESVSRTHARVDEVATTVSRVEGKLSELSHTSGLVLQHLIEHDK